VPRVETDGAHAPDQRFMLSLSRRAPHRKTPKITLIAAGSALALAGIAAASVAAWPGTAPAASADAASSFAGAQNMADSSAVGSVNAAVSVHQLKVSEAAARQAAVRQAIARQQARKEARVRAAAAARTAARAATQHQAASATPAAAAKPATPSGSPQQIAQAMLGSYGWSASQFSCLQPLWNAESGWNASASNPSSGAFGIPQALPGSKMASAGADWQTNPATQIRWGLGYIRSVYGSPCSAWSHEEAYGWY
jgi:hypothetical protein